MAKFYGIGVGPGDKELLTLKAARILSELDALILPEARKSTGSIAYEIAGQYVNPSAEIIYMEFPMVSDGELINEAGIKAAVKVEEYVSAGKNIGFITLGDPSIYSTYGYILQNLDSAVEVETIPGITSFCASAALLNKPLVEKEEILSIIPSTAALSAIEATVQNSDGIVFMKVYNHREKIVELLDQNGLLEKSVLIKRCGMQDCSISTDVRQALSEDRQYLSIILSRKENS